MNGRVWVLGGASAVVGAFLACSSSPDTPAEGTDAGAPEAAVETTCSAVLEQTLKPVDRVATTPVHVVSEADGERTLFIDAAAGGPARASQNPFVYVNLERGERVEVTDVSARTSDDWDLCARAPRDLVNGGDGGGGQGAAASVVAPFDSVTAERADAAEREPERFFDEECNAELDDIGALRTTFADWYGYQIGGNRLSPRGVTYVVRGGTGKRYKLAIQSYYGQADGGTSGAAGALFVVRVAPI